MTSQTLVPTVVKVGSSTVGVPIEPTFDNQFDE